MKILNPLRFLFILGNALLLFRNLTFKSRRTRLFIYSIILIDILLSISNSFTCIYIKMYKLFSDILHMNVMILNSIVLLLFSVYHSDEFKKMLIVLNSHNEFIIKDEMYLKKFERTKKIFFFALIMYTGLKLVPSLIYTRYFMFDLGLPCFVLIIFKINAVFWDARFFYEHLLMCALLYIFSEQLECIIRSIVKQKRFVNVNFDNSDQNIYTQYVHKISEWSDAFSYVEEAIKLYNRIFGIQFSIMLATSIFYVSSFLYDMTDLIVKRQIDTGIVVNYLTGVTVFHFHIFNLSKAGQRLNNNIEELKRRVGKIFILSLADDKLYKATEDFLDHICCGATRIQAFGSIDVNMGLAPTFIMLYTSYTILALQFNNIV